MSAHSLLVTSTSITLTPLSLAVANHLWQSTWVACVAGLLTLALRRNHPRARYWLWLAASLKFLVPFSLLMMVGGQLASLRHSTAPRHATAASFVAMEQISQPFTDAANQLTAQSATVLPAASASNRTVAQDHAHYIPAVLLAAWLIGFVGVTTRWILRWRRISAAIQLTEPLCEGREFEILQSIRRRAGVQRTIELRSLPASMEPGVFGLFRPVLLWPEAITGRLEDAHLETVLAHEVCHVRRRDNLTAAIHMVVEAIFWFHPLVWWLEARLVDEREHACDEEVLQLCGQRRVYAESILKVCEFCVESPLACVSGVTGADLKRRIVQILTERAVLKLTFAKKLLLVATGLLVVAAPIVLGQATAAQRMMLAAVKSAPMPFRVVARAMIAEEQTLSSGEIAEVQAPAEALPATQVRQKQLAELEAQESDLRTRYTPAFPEVREIQLRIEELRAGMANEGSAPAAALFVQGASREVTPGKDITGNWQGKMDANGRRILIKITSDDGKFRAFFYPLDQGGQPIAITSISLQGTAFNFAIQTMDLTYSGTLSADGNTITGGRTQGGQTVALNFQHVSEADTWAIPAPPKVMAADADPAYEVVTIKPADPKEQGRNWGQRGREVYMADATIAGLMQICYGIHEKQIVGAPDWVFKDKWDINGVPNVDGRANTDQMKTMFRKLLASRFQLKYHEEKRELPVYAIEVAKGGPKMTVSAPGQQGEGFGFRQLGDLMVQNDTMVDFANGMQRAVMDKPVVDRTGLTDHYDFHLRWTPDESQFIPLGQKVTAPATDDPKAPPSLSTALEEQLGLKLENTKADVNVMVIERLEKPSEN